MSTPCLHEVDLIDPSPEELRLLGRGVMLEDHGVPHELVGVKKQGIVYTLIFDAWGTLR